MSFFPPALTKSQPPARLSQQKISAKQSLGRYLDVMTWREAEAAFREFEVLVLPIGARCKEHGHHLPLNNDWLMAEYLAARVVERCKVLALPTVQYGYYPAFLEYPGSVSVGLETFRDSVSDIVRSLHRQGARKFYALNTGISTKRALEPAKAMLAAEGIVMEFTDLAVAASPVKDQLREQEAGTHADELETSMMLHIAPHVVRMERAQRDIHPEKGFGPLTRNPNAATGIYSPTGAWGDPTLATREKGRQLTEALVDHVVAEIEALASR